MHVLENGIQYQRQIGPTGLPFRTMRRAREQCLGPQGRVLAHKGAYFHVPRFKLKGLPHPVAHGARPYRGRLATVQARVGRLAHNPPRYVRLTLE
eukprot:scaffold3068_cov401-Prasinococcus_capsulatus_cf.AAC.33